jgi:hypothetical protein
LLEAAHREAAHLQVRLRRPRMTNPATIVLLLRRSIQVELELVDTFGGACRSIWCRSPLRLSAIIR